MDGRSYTPQKDEEDAGVSKGVEMDDVNEVNKPEEVRNSWGGYPGGSIIDSIENKERNYQDCK